LLIMKGHPCHSTDARGLYPVMSLSNDGKLRHTRSDTGDNHVKDFRVARPRKYAAEDYQKQVKYARLASLYA
jgi:hypothetical protein